MTVVLYEISKDLYCIKKQVELSLISTWDHKLINREKSDKEYIIFYNDVVF